MRAVEATPVGRLRIVRQGVPRARVFDRNEVAVVRRSHGIAPDATMVLVGGPLTPQGG